MIGALSLILLLLPLGIFIGFWVYASKRGWLSVRLLALSTMLYLSATAVVLWLGVREDWILRLGLGLSVASGIGLLLWPIIAPETTKKLESSGKHHSQITMIGNPSYTRSPRYFSATVVFVYIVLGYWFTNFLFDPPRFLSNFKDELWIVPLAFLMALVQYFSKTAQAEPKNKDT
jgi:membrane-bound acyltransferase YfiQ involved in biofilm formation